MADSTHTRNPSAIPQSPSRRHILTVGAPPMSGALAQAIERHKATFAALRAHHGPEDVPDEINDADNEAALTLANAPVGSDAELMEKLRVLMDYESYLWGEPN